MNPKLSRKQSSFFTSTILPSLPMKEPKTISLLKLMYFSSLFGMHLMFSSVLPRFLTDKLES